MDSVVNKVADLKLDGPKSAVNLAKLFVTFFKSQGQNKKLKNHYLQRKKIN
jgi:hypothetical protein